MMEFRLGEFPGAAHESKGIAKAPEPVGAFDPRRLVPQHPLRRLHAIRFRLLDGKRRHAAAAWRAGLLGQYTGHRIPPSAVPAGSMKRI